MRYNKKRTIINTVKCTHCFKSVSVPSRMAIYNYLQDMESASVTDIVDHVGLTQPTVSYHLKEMRHSGILRSIREGKEIHYAINTICPHHNQPCVLSGLKFPEVLNAEN